MITDDTLADIPALQYSLEELNHILDQAEIGQTEGRYTTNEEVFNELMDKFPFITSSFLKQRLSITEADAIIGNGISEEEANSIMDKWL